MLKAINYYLTYNGIDELLVGIETEENEDLIADLRSAQKDQLLSDYDAESTIMPALSRSVKNVNHL